MFNELSDFVDTQLQPHQRPLWGPHIGAQLLWDDSVSEEKRKMRIPRNGDGKNGDPEFQDTAYFPPLDKLVAVGVNGWDWPDGRSEYVAFDLDSDANHVEGLPREQLESVIQKLKAVPWVQIVRSKSGNGYHVYVFFDPCPFASTHTQHGHNAERVLVYLSGIVGIDLNEVVDAYGAIVWIWNHNTAPNGFELVKAATQKLDLSITPELPKEEVDFPTFKKTKRGPQHEKFAGFNIGKGGYFDSEGRLHGHTKWFQEAVAVLALHPGFETNSDGTDLAHENCFAYPGPNGSWRVFRHTKGVQEHESWEKTPNGWTATWLNRAPKKEKADPADMIVADAQEVDTLFHCGDIAYVETLRRGRSETLPIDSGEYTNVLRLRFHARHGKVAKAEWIKNAVAQLTAIAVEECDESPVYVRVAYHDRKLYVDLCDSQRTVIEIDGNGCRKADNPPVRFYRSDKMLPLPLPVQGGSLDQLREFVNVHSEDFPLFIAALLGCFQFEGTFAVIPLVGGDGRCKSSVAKTILMTVDPNTVQGCAPPGSNEDLTLAARQHYLMVFDNLSKLEDWLSDGLCRLASGSAYERRTKYRDADTSAFIAKRPVVLTSIRNLVSKYPDLLSRCLRFELPRVDNHRPEGELWVAFDKARPSILGALYDALSCGLRRLPDTHMQGTGRLVDFVRWCVACEPATGLPEGTILAAYQASKEADNAETLSTDFAQSIIALAEEGFVGNGKELAQKLELQTDDKQVREMVGELRTLQTALESKNVAVSFRKKSHGKRLIEIKAIR